MKRVPPGTGPSPQPKREKCVATIEARMTSSRLPGKVLLPLAGKPALERMVERVRRSRLVDEVVVATTTNGTDDPIVELCDSFGCRYFRGSEDDVLARVLGAARSVDATLIAELTGDCPLIDHRHIDRVIRLFGSGEYDLAANIVERTYPDGFDVQVFPVHVLARVDALTQDPVDRVHVTQFIYRNPDRFRLANDAAEGTMRWPELGITLDEEADYELIRRIFDILMPVDEDFSASEIVELLRERPDLVALNRSVRRKEPGEG